MPYIGVGIEDGLHTTIIHFDKLEGDDLEAVLALMDELQKMLVNPPYGIVGDRCMMGPRKNVPAIRVNKAEWFTDVYAWLATALDRIGVPYSKNHDYKPHVSKYTSKYTTRSMIPYLPWINLHMGSKHPGGHYTWEIGKGA